MSKKAEKIMERYLKGYVTEEQLVKYLELGAIMESEYEEIRQGKHGE